MVLGLVQAQEAIAPGLEDRGVFGKSSPLDLVKRADIHSKGELRPGWFHLAMRKEESLHRPFFLVSQRLGASHSIPLAQAGQESRRTGESDTGGVVRVHAGLAGTEDPARSMLPYQAGQPQAQIL